jgi:hypothetical protein
MSAINRFITSNDQSSSNNSQLKVSMTHVALHVELNVGKLVREGQSALSSNESPRTLQLWQ